VGKVQKWIEDIAGPVIKRNIERGVRGAVKARMVELE
jgi:hypothetical protein